MNDHNNTLSCFFIMPNPDNTFRIECRLVIYREEFGKHPDFLKPIGDAVTGYYTKYFLLIEDDILSKDLAEKACAKYDSLYAKLIENCENTGDWTDFPFKNNDIIYYK